jgi:hypothetical protein
MLLHQMEQGSGLKPSRQLGDFVGDRTVSFAVRRQGFGFFASGAQVTSLGHIVQSFHLCMAAISGLALIDRFTDTDT